MKTSRLALGANPCGATHPCASASTRPARSGRSLIHLFAILFLALIGETATAGSVNLAWNPNPEPDVAGYKLSYGTSPGSYSTTLSTGTATGTSVSGLNEGQTYYFVVTAVNTAGLEGIPSAEVSYQVPLDTAIILPSSGLKVASVSSQETAGNYMAAYAIDGNPATFWHSQWLPSIIPPPHEIQIDLVSIQSIQGFRYLPRQDGMLNGTFTQYEFHTSEDGVAWGLPAAAGNLAATSSMKEVKFAPRNARYIRFRGLAEATGQGYGNIAELKILAGDASTITVPATVNQAPVAAGQTKSTSEDSAVAITLTASDANGDPLTYSIVNAPSMGSLSGTAPNLTYTPATDANGTDSFTFRSNDGKADSNIATVSITVVPVNDAPTAAAQVTSTPEDKALGVILSASDRDGDSLSYRIVSGPVKGSLSGTAPNLTYTPAADANGTDSFSFRANDGKADSNIATVSITVVPVNDAPTAVAQVTSTPEDTALGILISASDKDGDALSYRIVSNPTKGSLSGTPPNLTYTPTANTNGSDSFTFVANDGKADSNIATVSITVVSVNDAPTAVAQITSTLEDNALSILLSVSDRDGDTLSYRIVSNPAKGSLSGTPPNLTYTPNAHAIGSDSFSFLANDGKADSNTATISISINPVNDAPVAAAQVISATAGTPVGIVLSASDTDGDPLSFSIVSGPLQGSLGGTPPNLTYTPNATASGSDSISFRASDGKVNSNTANISINIAPLQITGNKAPFFQADLITRASGKTTETYTADTLAGSALDPDADAVSYSKTSGPAWLTVSPDGNISGTPPAGAEGLNSFTIRASDPSGAFDEAVLEITIQPSTELPLPWSLCRIGSLSQDSTAWGDLVALNIKSSGSLASSADSGIFTWQTLSGDGEITARISTLENANSSSRIGLEIRESLAANAKHIFIGTDGSGSLFMVSRTKTGGSTSSVRVGSGRTPNMWLRLSRTGTFFNIFTSLDGASWKRVGRVTVTLGTSNYIGLMVSGGGNNVSTGTFQNLTVKP